MTAVQKVWDKVRALDIVSPSSVYRSLGADSPQERPFIVVQNAPSVVAFGRVHSRSIQVWMYDLSYTSIDDGLPAIRDAIMDDPTLGDAVFEGISEDLYDDQFRCATRYLSIRLPNSDG